MLIVVVVEGFSYNVEAPRDSRWYTSICFSQCSCDLQSLTMRQNGGRCLMHIYFGTLSNLTHVEIVTDVSTTPPAGTVTLSLLLWKY